MKNIETILKELGIEIPEDKKESFNKAVAENYKTTAEVQKISEKMEALTKKATDAEETLKKFEGIDPSKVSEELNGWKKKAEEAEAEYNRKIAERDFNDCLQKEIDSYKFSSAAARSSILERVKGAGLKLSNGKILGLNDLIEQIKEEDASAFVSAAEEHKARFTARKDGTGANLTKADILAIKDDKERLNMIANNLDLFD